MTQPFDFDQALKALQAGKSLTGKDSVLGPLIKQLTEAALTAELYQLHLLINQFYPISPTQTFDPIGV